MLLTDPETGVASGLPEAAMCVQNIEYLSHGPFVLWLFCQVEIYLFTIHMTVQVIVH